MNIGIIGLGLIGASLGKATKRVNGHTVYGYDVDDNVNLKAKLVGAVDGILTEDKVKESDFLFLAVYPRVFKETALKYLPKMKKGSTLVDLSGVKRQVVGEMEKLKKDYPEINFVSAHTMAGREFSGIDKSLATLFEKASVVITNVNADIFTVDKLKEFFVSLGFSETVFSTSENHDETIAFTSQLCHIVSNAFIKSPTAQKHFGYSAGSYKDLTRVARLNSTMWSELMQDNRDYLTKELKILIGNLTEYEKALENGDEKKLKELLEEGNKLKIEIDKGKR